MSDMKSDKFEPELLNAGRAVARLSRPKAPSGLVARTLDRLAKIKPEQRKLLIFRSITHPVARIAAVVMLTLLTVPLTDLDVVAAVGSRIENHVIGTNGVNRVERIVDEIVPSDENGYSQSELVFYTGVYNGVYNANIKATRPKSAKPRANSRV